MHSAVWLVSYPRSGNTYLRALLANYVSGLPRPMSLDELSASTSGEHDEAFWREVTGKPAADRSLEEEWLARQAYFRALRARAPGPGFLLKSHTMNGVLAGQRAYEFLPQDRIVHVLRHPCDVAMSCADFYGITLEESVSRLLTEGLFVDARPELGFEVLGSWAQHTRSWMAETSAPVHRIRYFDLVGDPAGALRGLLAFLNVPVDEARVRAAVEFSRFDSLRAQEDVGSFRERPKSSHSGRFFRVGRSLQWLDALTPEQADRLVAPNRDLLDELGFTAFVEQELQRRTAASA